MISFGCTMPAEDAGKVIYSAINKNPIYGGGRLNRKIWEIPEVSMNLHFLKNMSHQHL